MDYPLEKLFGYCFFNWVFVRRPIFWEIGHFCEFQKNGAKKVKRRSIRKGKEK